MRGAADRVDLPEARREDFLAAARAKAFPLISAASIFPILWIARAAAGEPGGAADSARSSPEFLVADEERPRARRDPSRGATLNIR